MRKRLINITDSYRALITETLPYEVPIYFSNFDFHTNIVAGNFKQSRHLTSALFSDFKKPLFIPFNYALDEAGKTKRTLSVMHPAAQLMFCNFYAEHKELIIHYCNRSHISLRRPHSVASRFYEKDLADSTLKTGEIDGESDDIETVPEPFGAQAVTASSYFVYREYSFFPSFFSSEEFINLEKHYQHYAVFDVARCFYNIYTHSLSWAIKSKSFAKANIGDNSFGESFDQIMQAANYKETNGILVGPEVSRIFAEIIFQAIDLDIYARLSDEDRRNVVLRRYVDDFVIFFNDKKSLDRLIKIAEDSLENYKLYLNTSKTEISSRPFISPLSTVKLDVSRIMDDFKSKLIEIAAETKNRSPRVKSTRRRVIDELRKTGSLNSVDISKYSKYALSITYSLFANYLRHLENNSLSSSERVFNFAVIKEVIELAFYLYAMEATARSTIFIGRMLTSLQSKAKKYNSGIEFQELLDLAVDRSFAQLTITANSDSISSVNRISIANLNLLAALSSLDDRYAAPVSLIRWLSGDDKGSEFKTSLNYFEITGILFYLRGRNRYSYLRRKIIRHAIDSMEKRVNRLESFSQSSELFMLATDLVACPWVNENEKIEISRMFVTNIEPTLKNPNKVYAAAKQFVVAISKQNWFVDWHAGARMASVLVKKELKTPYDR